MIPGIQTYPKSFVTLTCLGDGGIACLFLICDTSFPGKFLDLIFIVGNMIRLFKVKEKQRAENTHGTTGVKKQSAGELRLHKGKPYYV